MYKYSSQNEMNAFIQTQHMLTLMGKKLQNQTAGRGEAIIRQPGSVVPFTFQWPRSSVFT